MLSRREVVVLTLLFVASLPAVTRAPLFLRRGRVLLIPAFALVRPRRVLRERSTSTSHDHRIAQSADFHRTFLESRHTHRPRVSITAPWAARILWAPFYAAADVATRVLRSAGRDIAADGYSRLYISAVAYGSAFYGFAAIVLSDCGGAAGRGPTAFSSGLAVWAGTPLLFYMYIAPPFSHACSAFAVALFVDHLAAGSGYLVRPGTIALGLAGALMAMVRETGLILRARPSLRFGPRTRRRGKR
jgi:hypothetical protein